LLKKVKAVLLGLLVEFGDFVYQVYSIAPDDEKTQRATRTNIKSVPNGAALNTGVPP